MIEEDSLYGDDVTDDAGRKINPIPPTAKKEFKKIKRQITAKDTEF